MHSALKNVADLWRARKGLLVLLMAGAVIVVLAAVAPGAWATSGQSPHQQTIVLPCVGPLVGAVFEDVDQDGFYTVGDIGIAGVKVTLDPGTTGERVTFTDDGSTYGQGAGFFVFGPTVSAGTHVVQIEVPPGYVSTGPNPQTVTVPDWDPGDPGCASAFFPLRRIAVGGHVMPPSKLTLLVPLLGLAALVGVLSVSVIVWRRRRQA